MTDSPIPCQAMTTEFDVAVIGDGHCNFTNRDVMLQNFLSQNLLLQEHAVALHVAEFLIAGQTPSHRLA